MIVLDSYAVIAFLRDEPAADEVASLMRSDEVSLTAIGVSEVVDHLMRLAGVDEDDAFLDLAEMDALTIDATVGGQAGRLRARYYHRTRCAVSMADCLAAAVAHDRAVPLATSDSQLLELCHSEGIATIVLPDSNGASWTPPQ